VGGERFASVLSVLLRFCDYSWVRGDWSKKLGAEVKITRPTPARGKKRRGVGGGAVILQNLDLCSHQGEEPDNHPFFLGGAARKAGYEEGPDGIDVRKNGVTVVCARRVVEHVSWCSGGELASET